MPTFRQITQTLYNEMLQILLPDMRTYSGFMGKEPLAHRLCGVRTELRATYAACVRYDGKYYEASEPMTRPEFRSLLAGDLRQRLVEIKS